MDTSRWSCAPKLGGTCTISYDLGAVRDIYELRLGRFPGYGLHCNDIVRSCFVFVRVPVRGGRGARETSRCVSCCSSVPHLYSA